MFTNAIKDGADPKNMDLVTVNTKGILLAGDAGFQNIASAFESAIRALDTQVGRVVLLKRSGVGPRRRPGDLEKNVTGVRYLACSSLEALNPVERVIRS